MPWIALIGPEVEENLALRYLASALHQAGLASELLPLNSKHDVVRVLDHVAQADEPPLLVALSLAFQWRAPDVLALALGLRERGYTGHITAGGHFGSFTSAQLLDSFGELDSICVHEAEVTLVELAQALAGGRSVDSIDGLATRGRDGPVALSRVRPPAPLGTQPWPDRRGAATRCLGHRIAPLIGSRGCYARCAFCCIAAWHRMADPTLRFRLRPVDELADEMAWLHHDLGVEIFIFHDDNFFLPRSADSLQRVHALADALAARGVQRFATVVKARPPDVTVEVMTAMRDRLRLSRVFLGVESDAAQGLRTLGRGVRVGDSARALAVLDALGIYPCFNLLVFDPDTTLESLADNLAFMRAHAHTPHNFGRVELYAGTPLLERMQAEGRARGDVLGWDYSLDSPAVQRAFEWTQRCFHARNFGEGALNNRLMGTRYDVEVARHFHPDRYRPQWLAQARSLTRELVHSSVDALEQILGLAADPPAALGVDQSLRTLSRALRQVEQRILREAEALEHAIRSSVGASCQHARPGWAETPSRVAVVPNARPASRGRDLGGVHESQAHALSS